MTRYPKHKLQRTEQTSAGVVALYICLALRQAEIKTAAIALMRQKHAGQML
jgi:hypothetical protein